MSDPREDELFLVADSVRSASISSRLTIAANWARLASAPDHDRRTIIGRLLVGIFEDLPDLAIPLCESEDV